MKHFACLFAVVAEGAFTLRAAPFSSIEGGAGAPPPPPAITITVEETQNQPRLHAAANVYSIGDPTPEEQLYLEFMNRARANPAAEASLLATTTDPSVTLHFKGAAKVDLDLFKTQFAALAPVQPLAMNAKLTTAARGHSTDMLNNVFQEHDGSDGSTLTDRIRAVAYGGAVGENIYANAESVFHGHAAFEIDWSGFPANGGMQSPPGHRQAIHNALYREVGVGVALGRNSVPGKTPLDHVGPQLVTQDFGVAQNSTPLITGVAYYDLNGNNFYDLGEGIGNVKVTVSVTTFQGITARSGGYAVPVPTNNTYTVTFSGPGFSDLTRTVSVTGSRNQKLDFTPPYNPPVINGPLAAAIGRINSYSISPVAGSVAYEWRSFQHIGAAKEGAENDVARITIDQIPGYDVIEALVVKGGQFAFHLTVPANDPRGQYITLSPTYTINGNSALTFQSMLGVAAPEQHARVQISTDAGGTWQTIYNQNGAYDPDGTGPNLEDTFRARTVNLGAFAGKNVRFRFAYEWEREEKNVFYVGNDLNIGWIIDDIEFSNVDEVASEKVASANGIDFQFDPGAAGDFTLQARARTGHDFLPWGPSVAIRAVQPSGPAELRVIAIQRAGAQLQVDFDLLAGATPSNFTLESRNTLSEPWQSEAATVQSLTSTQFRVLADPAGARTRFYQIRAD